MRVTAITVALIALSGCASYDWRQGEAVQTALVHKVESPLSAEFCTKLLLAPKRGCAVRITNTETGVTNCVLLSMPGDLYAVRHEAGGHCMGQDH